MLAVEAVAAVAVEVVSVVSEVSAGAEEPKEVVVVPQEVPLNATLKP